MYTSRMNVAETTEMSERPNKTKQTGKWNQEFRVVRHSTDNIDEVDKKFNVSRKRTYIKRRNPNQEWLNTEMGRLEENGWLSLFICTKAEYDDPLNDKVVEDLITNYRAMVKTSVEYNDYPYLAAGSKRRAYSTTKSLEEDGNYWLLVRRLIPMVKE